MIFDLCFLILYFAVSEIMLIFATLSKGNGLRRGAPRERMKVKYGQCFGLGGVHFVAPLEFL